MMIITSTHYSLRNGVLCWVNSLRRSETYSYAGPRRNAAANRLQS